MAFSVPEKVSVTQETHDIGLMEIGATKPCDHTILCFISREVHRGQYCG